MFARKIYVTSLPVTLREGNKWYHTKLKSVASYCLNLRVIFTSRAAARSYVAVGSGEEEGDDFCLLAMVTSYSLL